MKLNRVYPGEDGKCSFLPGSYGKEGDAWYLRLPERHIGSLVRHAVTEHEDGTITVSPSILHHEPPKLDPPTEEE